MKRFLLLFGIIFNINLVAQINKIVSPYEDLEIVPGYEFEVEWEWEQNADKNTNISLFLSVEGESGTYTLLDHDTTESSNIVNVTIPTNISDSASSYCFLKIVCSDSELGTTTDEDFSSRFKIVRFKFENTSIEDTLYSWKEDNIQWRSWGIDSAKLKLMIPGLNDIDINIIGTANSVINEMNWTVEDIEETNCQFLIKEQGANGGNSLVEDFSETFRIVKNQDNYIAVSSPDGGESWEQGSSKTITWRDNIEGNVKIEYIKGVAVPEEIKSSITNEGEFLWEIPSSLDVGEDYKIIVTSVDDPTVSDVSNAVFSIIESQTVPEIPTLESPEDFAQNQPLEVTLNWSDPTGATSYNLQYATDQNFTTDLKNKNDLTVSDYTFSQDELIYDKTYYWRVQAKYGTEVSNWSDAWSFKTEGDPNKVPDKISLISPDTNAVKQPLDVTLDWRTDEKADTYDIQIALDSTFNNLELNINKKGQSHHKLSEGILDNLTKYYWRVRGVNIDGKGQWSNIWSFTTVTTPPESPVLISPENGADNQSLFPTLVWHPSERAIEYRFALYRSEDLSSSFLSGNVGSDTVVTIGPRKDLDYGTTYYWRIQAKNEIETWEAGWSELWSFTTMTEPQTEPDSPFLESPEDGAVDQALTLKLDWSEPDGSTSYNLQYATDENFTTDLENKNDLTVSEYTFLVNELEYEKIYYWRVQAKNDAGESGWSEVRDFTTMAEPQTVPEAPALESPEDGAVDQALTLKLEWSEPDGSTSYNLQYTTDENFTTDLENKNDLTASEYTFLENELEYNQKYYWRVQAKNNAGVSTWSEERDFITKDKPLITISSPQQNDAWFIDGEYKIEWNYSDGSVSIELLQLETVIRQISSETGESSLLWIVPQNIPEGENYKIKITDITNEEISEESGEFAIKKIPVPTLISPIDNIITSRRPTFSWEYTDSVGIDNFQLVVNDTLIQVMPNKTEFVFDDIFEEDRLINWSVSALKDGGISEVENKLFTTIGRNSKLFEDIIIRLTPEPVGSKISLSVDDIDNIEIDFFKRGLVPFDNELVQLGINYSQGIINDLILAENDRINLDHEIFFPEKFSFTPVIVDINDDGTYYKINEDQREYNVEAQGTLTSSAITSNSATWNNVTFTEDNRNSITQWKLFGASIDGINIQKSFIDELNNEPMNKAKWVIYEYLNSDYSLVDDNTLKQGKAYFIAQAVDPNFNIDFSIENFSTATEIESAIKGLDASIWNSFSIPYTFPVYFKSSQDVLYYDQNRDEKWPIADSILYPFTGYFVKGVDSISISVNKIDEQGSSLSLSKWNLNILTNIDGFKTSRSINLLGNSSNTLEKGNSNKFINKEIPPSLNKDYIISLTNEESKNPLLNSTCLSSEGGSWSVSIHNNRKDNTAKISKEIVGDIPDFYNTVILNPKSGAIYTEEEIEIFVRQGETSSLKVVLGTESYIEEQIEIFKEGLPKNYSLLQNYPNPFNPSTIIEYSIPEYSHVELFIYNLLGEKVVELVNEYQNPGFYSIPWNVKEASRSISSGVYFYSIRSNNYQNIKKMILLK